MFLTGRQPCELEARWAPFSEIISFWERKIEFFGVGVDFFLVFLRMPKNKEAVQNDLHIFLL